jgi:hypothetical protein
MARAGVATIAAVGLLAAVLAASGAGAETTLKFGPYNAESHPMHKAAVQFTGIPQIASVPGFDGAPRRAVRQPEGPLEARARPA